MFKKILVCLDGSELAEKILPYAVEQAKRFGSELILFKVFSEPTLISLALPGIPGVPIDTAGAQQRLVEDEKVTEEYLKNTMVNLQAEKTLRVSYAFMRGAAGPAIIEYCDQHEIELIAIATHGRSGPGRVVLGSVADYVIHHSRLPILLVRPTMEKGK
jgi:nucleotide-binding universal stress UspA family protein